MPVVIKEHWDHGGKALLCQISVMDVQRTELFHFILPLRESSPSAQSVGGLAMNTAAINELVFLLHVAVYTFISRLKIVI
jgi:hypothetical protein